MAAKLYLCKNPSCSLGSLKGYGRFTGGITKEQATMLTGNPEPDHGPGVCPNCGVKGEAFDPMKAVKGALFDAEAQHAERVRAIKEGVN